jgi:sec-independent protein translocase protein TatB
MFDIGGSEILLTAFVALIVLGPERLPKAARFAGLWIRRARAQWASVRAELERELEAERLRADLDAATAQAVAPMRDALGTLRELDGAVPRVDADEAGRPPTAAP